MVASTATLPLDFTDWLSATAFTPDNIARANDYLTRVRGLDPAQLPCAFALTGPALEPWLFTQPWRQPFLFTDSLFIPLFDLTQPAGTRLAGFDIRYCGLHPYRSRFIKIKRMDDVPLLYSAHEAIKHRYCVVTEAAIDSQSCWQCGHPSISPLTAQGSPQFALLLYGLFDRVLIAYDNDTNGDTQAKRLLEAAGKAGPEVAGVFARLGFRGKDLNQMLLTNGGGMVADTIRSQL